MVRERRYLLLACRILGAFAGSRQLLGATFIDTSQYRVLDGETDANWGPLCMSATGT